MAVNELVDGEFEIWRNDQWRVTNMFMEEVANPGLAGPPYWLNFSMLRDREMIEHVCSKTWVKPELFVEAYRKAAQVAGFEPNEDEIARALNPAPINDELSVFLREALG
jgi:Mg2+ and Co2+ transporter CorA